MNPNPLRPSVALLSKLGSILIHFMEGHAAGGHVFDIQAMTVLLEDEEVRAWLGAMDRLAFIPKMRDAQTLESLKSKLP